MLEDMAETPDTSLYPLHRCKTLHLVRHGQGYHNVAGEKDYVHTCHMIFLMQALLL